LAETPVNDGRRSAVLRALKRGGGFAFAALLLAWVLHDIEGKRLFENVRTMRWGWIAAGLALDTLSYAVRSGRWALLFRPLGHLPFGRIFEANYAGLFLNEVLPMRIGEAARAFLIARRLRVEVARVVPSMVLERIFEGLWLALAAGLVGIVVPIPKKLAREADIFGAALLVLTGIFIVYSIRRPKEPAARSEDASSPRPRWKARIESVLSVLGEGFREIGLDRTVGLAFLLTLPYFLLQGLAFWSLLIAYRISIPLGAGLAVFLIVHLGTSLPGAPANVGPYQFFCVLGLTFFGVDKTAATGFSIVGFLLLTLTMIAIGFVAFLRSGLDLGSLRKRPSPNEKGV
jgi:glycosyltransferase 2 family protein